MRSRFAIVAFSVFVGATAIAQTPRAIVLKVTTVAIDPSDNTRMVLTLASGAIINVRLADIDAQATVSAKDSGAATASITKDADGIIQAKCAKEWPTDFSVRVYCVRTQREAVSKLSSRTMSTTDQRTIRTQCASEWPTDFSVRNYCEETQLKALQELGR